MTKILMLGSRGPDVEALQRLLNCKGANITVDGNFGGNTDKAVRAAQTRLGLVVDGKAGPQTMLALGREQEKPGACRVEPNKSAMDTKPQAQVIPLPAVGKAPPNAPELLDTARPINELIVHCAATPEGKDFTVEDIRSWHKQRGWTDIGYHYVVYRDGSIHLGRPVGQIGSHVAGRNTGTIGICYIGGVSADGKVAKDTRTPEQQASLLWLVSQLRRKHTGVRKVSGHNEYAAKACPSFNVQQDALAKAA